MLKNCFGRQETAMTKAVLDKTALLGFLGDELDDSTLEDGLSGYAVSAVTLSDVYGHLVYKLNVKSAIVEDILDQAFTVIPFDAELAELAAQLRPLTEHHGLDLPDRCCLATAKALGKKVITADRAWAKLAIAEIDIEVLA